MNTISKTLALMLLVLAMPAAAAASDDPLDSSQWRYMLRQYFPDAKVVFDDRVQVVAPDYAEDSLATPVQVRADPSCRPGAGRARGRVREIYGEVV